MIKIMIDFLVNVIFSQKSKYIKKIVIKSLVNLYSLHETKNNTFQMLCQLFYELRVYNLNPSHDGTQNCIQ